MTKIVGNETEQSFYNYHTIQSTCIIHIETIAIQEEDLNRDVIFYNYEHMHTSLLKYLKQKGYKVTLQRCDSVIPLVRDKRQCHVFELNEL